MSIDEQVAAVDLEYSLAIDGEGSSVEGVYVDRRPAGGARICLTDEVDEICHYLSAAECIRLGTYLLACGQAAGS